MYRQPSLEILFRTIGHPEEIAQQIALYLRKRPQLKALYIAAPLEEANLIENIRKELNGEFPIFTGETLLQYMFDTYPNCQWMKVCVFFILTNWKSMLPTDYV